MQRRFRLSRSEDFKRVRRTGKSFAHPLVVLVVQTSDRIPPQIRVGVTAGKTTGTAVHRNRAKRLLREAVRPLITSLDLNLDLILIARPALANASLIQTRSALLTVFHRAKILPANEFPG